MQKYCILTYENGKMRHVETISEMEGGGMKNNGGNNSTMIYCKKVGKCHSVSPVQK
jgi:hypothetical protein